MNASQIRVLSMARMDGITATRLIRTQNPRIVVVGLTVDLKDYHVYAMKKAGAFEVLKKDDVLADLYSTLQRAVASVQPVVILHESPSPTQAPRDQEQAVDVNPAEPAVDQSSGVLIQDN